jgi:3-deoxy-D-manno-octulosonic acid (KDO) 8-phosphate synthase
MRLIPSSSRAGRAHHQAATAASSRLWRRAAVAVGVAGVFIETHEDPDIAPSDGPNMIKLTDLPALVERLMAFDRVAKG